MLLAQWVFSAAQQILGSNADGTPFYCTVPVALIHKKKLHHRCTHIYLNHIPHPEPMPTDSPEASGPCKWKLSTKVTTNGNPEVKQKRKKIEAKKQSLKPAPFNSGPCKNKDYNKGSHKTSPTTTMSFHWDWGGWGWVGLPHLCPTLQSTTHPKGRQWEWQWYQHPSTTSEIHQETCYSETVPSVEIKEVFNDELDCHTSVPPCNPQHILEAADGSDDDEEDPVPNGNEEGEAPEESNEAELGM